MIVRKGGAFAPTIARIDRCNGAGYERRRGRRARTGGSSAGSIRFDAAAHGVTVWRRLASASRCSCEMRCGETASTWPILCSERSRA